MAAPTSGFSGFFGVPGPSAQPGPATYPAWGTNQAPAPNGGFYQAPPPLRLQVTIGPGAPHGLLDVFTLMATYARHHAGSTVVCWNFLPGLHLYLWAPSAEPHHELTLLEDWRRLEGCINHWIDDGGPRQAGVGVQAFLTHSRALITTRQEPDLHHQISVEITRLWAQPGNGSLPLPG